MEPGERIRKLREAKGQNQKEFGDIIGFSRAYVSEIERGVKPPSPEFLEALNKKFGASPGYILYGLSNDHWDTIKKTLQSGEISDEALQKLKPLLSPSETGDLLALDPVGGYEKRLPENAATRGLIDNVLKILNSGNPKIITALTSNIEAFIENIELRYPQMPEDE